MTGSSNSNSSSANGGCKMIKKILKLDLNRLTNNRCAVCYDILVMNFAAFRVISNNHHSLEFLQTHKLYKRVQKMAKIEAITICTSDVF